VSVKWLIVPVREKKCVRSMNEKVEFVTSVLGNNVVVRKTENIRGSGEDVMIGKVSKINRECDHTNYMPQTLISLHVGVLLSL